METYIFNEFLVLEETNSFSKAAKQLRMSQATLSRHIKQLEDEYGVSLFERTTQKMKLTPFGESLVEYARNILENERSFKRDVEKIKFKNSNHLVIGSVDFPFYYGITAHMAGFKKEHPNATLEVIIHSTDDLIKDLENGLIDVAFLRNIKNVTDDLDSFEYTKDKLYIAIPSGHPLAGRKSATFADLKDDVFYKRYKKNSLMDKMLDDIVAEESFTPHFSASEASWEDSVINDINTITLCTGGLAETFRGNVHVKVLTLAPERSVNLHLARKKDGVHSEISNQFVKYVRTNLNIQST